MSACIVLIGALSPFAFGQSPSGSVPDALRVECACFRRPGIGSAGTAHLFLKNVGKRSVVVTELELDGYRVPISDAPEEVQAQYQRAREAAHEKAQQGPLKIDKLAVAAQRILWSKVEPNPVPVGGAAVVTVKLAQDFTRPFTVTVSGNEQGTPGHSGPRTTVSRTFLPVNAPVRIESVGFNSSKGGPETGAFDRIYVYLRSGGGDPPKPTRITIDGTDLTANSQFLPVPEPAAAGTGPNPQNGPTHATWLIAINLPKPVAQGKPLVVMVGAAESGVEGKATAIAACRVRAFSHFPISTESGGTYPDDLGLDPVPFAGPYAKDRNSIVDKTNGAAEPKQNDYLIFQCPTHSYGADYRRSALEIIWRSHALFGQDPFNAASVHLCRLKPIEGARAFGELADIARVNAGLLPQALRSARKEQRKGRHFSQFLVAGMREAAGPGTAIHAVVPAGLYEKGKMIAPEHLRLSLFAAMAAGARGVLYRSPAWSGRGGRLREVVTQANHELQTLKPLLRFAHPVPLAQTSDESVEAATLLAGNRAIVVIVLNHAVDPVDRDLCAFRPSDRSNVLVEIHKPPWFEPGEAFEACGTERKPLELSRGQGTFRFSIRELETARAFVILNAPGGL